MIAMALANEPDLLIADEPTTALDVTVQAQILELLKELQKRLGMAMLFITHDLGIVRKLADTVCVMKEGKIVEQGPVERVFTAPQHPYTKALLAAEPKPDPAPLQPAAPVVIEAKDLKVWFPIKRGVMRRVVGHIKAVDGVEHRGAQGRDARHRRRVGLGQDHARACHPAADLLARPDRLPRQDDRRACGSRRCCRSAATCRSCSRIPTARSARACRSPTSSRKGCGCIIPSCTEAEREQRVVRALRDVGLDPETRFRYPHEFSGGQRQRIALARAIVLEPTFVVLDEPTSALDMLIQAQMVDLLRDLQRRHDLTYLFISHDLRVVAALASRLIVMRHGKVVEEGPAGELFANPKSDYTRALFAAAFNLETAPEGVVAQ